MALSAYEKNSIVKYVKTHALGQIYYLDLCAVLSKGRKASYQELIEFFAAYVLDNLNKNTTTPKVLEKFLNCMNTFLTWCLEDNLGIEGLLFGKLNTIAAAYTENYTLDKEGILEPEINHLKEILNEYDAPQEKLVSYYIEQMDGLQRAYDQLHKDYESLLARCQTLDSEQASKNQKLKKQQSIVTDLQNEKVRLKNEVTRLNREIQNLQAAFDRENAELRSSLTEANTKIATQEQLLDGFTLKSQEQETKENQIKLRSQRQAKIEKLLLSQLAEGQASLEDVAESMSLPLGEIKDDFVVALTHLQKLINIQPKKLASSPQYVIVPPDIATKETLDLIVPPECRTYDILLVSDIHISQVSNEVIRDCEQILNYCTKHGIKLILNAGDYFSFSHHPKNKNFGGVNSAKKLVEQAITNLPSAPGIYHAVLGGNHDRICNPYGIDAISALAAAREDFISLGYGHATITINGIHSLLTSFMIHHPTFKYPDPTPNEPLGNQPLANYLKSYYANFGIDREDSYLDIVGHGHLSYLDTLNGICNVPSLRFDRQNNGAWHLKIYFDEQTNIKYMVFKALNYHNRLIPTTEMVYQHLTLKK